MDGDSSLCERCAHVREVRTPRGSRFLLCLLSRTDDRFPRYPPQPVPRCPGFAREGVPMSDLRLALDQIAFARRYTVALLDAIGPGDWFRMPAEGVTHVAWQVGHLAFAQYRLALERVRGRRPGDDELIPPAFFVLFGRDSVPQPDPDKYPTPAEVRAVFDRVHERVLSDLAGHPEADLDSPPLAPHALARTKREVLFWCGQHEFLHAGQIGLLRRLLGYPPMW